ncbi:hypothetical protein PG996_004193 [Apiospora saccharicola]|uniref:Uncharacterized protein n=1 Tax=Apiospora saccharicola TaxID=335842 RepID=A0ABR1W3I7_9PEZI
MFDINVNKTRGGNTSNPNTPRSGRDTSQALQLRSVSSPASGSATISFGVQEQGSDTVTMIHMSAAEINDIGARLAAARANAELPDTTAPGYNLEIMYQDYQRLLYLQRLRGDVTQPASDGYNAAFVEVNREIAQRDVQFREQQQQTETQLRMENIREHLNAQVREHNARQAAIEAVANAIRNGQAQNVDASVVMNEIRSAVQTMAGTQAHGIDGANMDAVMEEVFATIETALLDAAGPLRLNNQQYNQNNARLDQTSNRLGDQVNNMTAQLGAMNNHVSAVSNHVSALGTLLHSVNTISNATNNQAGQLSREVNILQEVVRMIPAVVEQAVQQQLSETIHAAMGPALLRALTDSINRVNAPRQRTRRSFFAIFKRNGKGGRIVTVQ